MRFLYVTGEQEEAFSSYQLTEEISLIHRYPKNRFHLDFRC
jgi:hypothetical protein